MSEGNDLKLENTAPETAEDIQQKAQEAEQAAEAPESVETAGAPEYDDRENAPRQRAPQQVEVKESGKKRSVLVPLLIILLVVVLAGGAVLGCNWSRVRGGQQEPEQPEAAPSPEATEDIPAYDAFVEELTEQNRQALDTLAGEDGYFDEGASALLGEDEILEAERADAEAVVPAEEAVVVAEYGDGQQLMSDEVLEEYSEQLSMYILSGYSEEEIAETLLDDVLQTMVTQRVLAEHAKELGLYELNDDDRAEIEAQATELYDEYVSYYRETMVDEEGLSAEEANAEARDYLLDAEGVTYEGLISELGESWWEQKLYDEITKDVTVGDAAVKEFYDELVDEQMENFAEFPDDFEFTQMSGEIIVYNLPGYRAVKLLLLGFEDEETAMTVYNLIDEIAYLDEEDAELAAERQEALDECYADLEARADEVLEELRAGADMDEMIRAYGTDEGMEDERLREMGYYVSADSLLWPEEFVAAAMELENVGDYSEPVRVEEGVCILQYLGEVAEGKVPLADVRQAMEAETLDSARYDIYEEQVNAWLAEADPSYYPERMQ